MPDRVQELLQAALSYARMGWHVFPVHNRDETSPSRCSCRAQKCPSPAKHPRTQNGLKDASADSDVIGAWWTQWPRANIAVATGAISGVVVLDIDPRHGGDVSLESLEDLFGKLPHTVECLTGGGGRHIYFKHPGGYVPNSSGKLGRGVDVRGDGGYVLAPPSDHVDNREYVWEASSEPEWK